MAPVNKPKSLAATSAKITVTVAVIGFIVWRLGWHNIVETLAQANYWWIAAGLVLFFASGVLGVWQWQILLANKHIAMPFGRALSLYFIGMFFNNFVVGGVAGDAVKVALIRTGDGSGKAGLAAVFLDRFAGLLAMAGLAVAGSAVLIHRGLLGSGRIETAALALSVTFVLFCGILVFLVSTRVQRVSFRVISSLPLPKKDQIVAIVNEIVLEAHDRHIIAPIALLSTVIQIMRVGVHIVCAASLGLLSAENYQYFFIFVPFLAMLMMIPLPFGIKEGVGGSLFFLAGFGPQSPHLAVVMVFLASLVGIAASLPGGIFFITSKLSSGRHQ